MRAIILKGDVKLKEEYIYRYIRDNQIPEYNITRFEQALKIVDARQIKSALGKTSMSGKNRLFIISHYPNTEAQNALLKTLEELDASTDFIFSCEEELLPTVVSRCTMVVLSTQKEDHSTLQLTPDIIEKLVVGDDIGRKFLAAQDFFSEVTDDPYQELILELRRIIKNHIRDNDLVKSARLFPLLKNLNSEHSLILSNNLNPKVAVEKIILGLTT